MSEKELRYAILHWYCEALDGNSVPFACIAKSIETFYLFDLISDDLYEFSCYLSEYLYEHGYLSFQMLSDIQDGFSSGQDSDSVPFPGAESLEEEVLPFA